MNSSKGYDFEVPIVNGFEMVVGNSCLNSAVKVENQGDNDIMDISEIKSSKESLAEDTVRLQKPGTTVHNINYNNQIPLDLDEDDCTIIDDEREEKQKSKILILPKSFKTKLKQDLKCYEVPSKEFKTQKICSSKNSNEGINVKKSDNAIVIEEDSDKDNDCDILECITVKEADKQVKKTNREDVVGFEEILQKDKVVAELIELCLDMENSTGMLRIINRTVMPIYRDTSEDFKKSNIFQRHLTKALMKLQTEPHKKFTHLKDFCEFMKTGIYKKRVELTTLETKLNGKDIKKYYNKKKSLCSNGTPVKKRKLDVINLDNDDEDNDIGANVDVLIAEDTNNPTNALVSQDSDINKDLIERNTPEKNSDTPINDNKVNGRQIVITDVRSQAEDISNKSENNNNTITNVSNTGKGIFVNNGISNKNENNNESNINDIILIDDEIDNSDKENISRLQNDSDKSHLVEALEVDLSIEIGNADGHININNSPVIPEDDTMLKLKIQQLETSIKKINDMIVELENKELDWDNDDHERSPYVLTEFYKEQLLIKYKALCELTCSEAVKRRKVRLKVAEGRHEGPVRFLEEFINSRIDENGNPPFPDMQDVMNCVEAANLYYSLGWEKKTVVLEARALFIRFGETVQKSRRKREWRHLMRYAKQEVVDPADADPLLQARLEDNARLALKNEQDLLSRYVEMENYGIKPVDPSPSNDLHNNSQESFPNISAEVNLPNEVIPASNEFNIVQDNANTSNERLQNNSYNDSCSVITENMQINKCKKKPKNIINLPFQLPRDKVIPVVYCTLEGKSTLLGNIIPLPPKNGPSSTTNGPLPTTNGPLPTTNGPLPTTNDQLPTTNDQLPTTNGPLPTTNGQDRDIVEEDESSDTESTDDDSTMDEREMLEIEKDTKPNLDRLNADIDNIKALESNKTLTNYVEATASKVATIQDHQEPSLLPQKTYVSSDAEISVFTHTTRETEKEERTAAEVQASDNMEVKKEPLDIPRMLAELGDDYTVTIMNIEDPFEIVEISDSSDSEEEEDLLD